MDIKPRENQIEKEKKWNDPVMITVPDLKGMTIKEIQQQMYNLQLKTSGEGSKVIQQSPKPGAKVEEGSAIRVYLE